MQNKQHKVTLKHIAKAVNLSVNTISRALNDKDGVSEQTRQRIRQIASEMNYRPNLLAKSMRKRHADFIGVLTLDLGNTVFTKMIKGIEEEALKNSMTIIIGNSDNDAAKEAIHLETMLSVQCSGIIIMHVAEVALKLLKEESIPFVVLDRDTAGIECDQVYVDYQRMGYLATDHLLQLGHRDIALITKTPVDAELSKRIEGFKLALDDFGLPVRPDRIHLCRDAQEGGHAFETLWGTKNKPTALIIGQHNVGEGVITALNKLKVNVPRDLSVVVIGEPTWANLLPIGYTTVERPLEEMGSRAAKLLIKRVKEGLRSPCINELVSAELIVRGSTASLS